MFVYSHLYMAPPKSLGHQIRDLDVEEAEKDDQNEW
jgi:hypothetical protein